jgi:hypothetical protein
MTKAQAEALIEKKVGKVAQDGLKLIDSGTPKLKAMTKKVNDEVKTGQSADLLETLLRALKVVRAPVAQGAEQLEKAVQLVNEFEKNEEIFELLADEFVEGMKELTGPLEKARKDLVLADQARTAAEKKMDVHGRDSSSAEREWVALVAAFERRVGVAKKEFEAWLAYEKDVQAAVKARDKGKLAALRKAKPAAPTLAEFPGMKNSDAVSEDFRREYAIDGLSKELQARIKKDREGTISLPFVTTKVNANKRIEIEKRLDALVIEPRDGRKALTALGLPPAALAKVQAALDGPDGPRAKLLAGIAKAFKVELAEKDVDPRLTKAGVL